MDDPLPPRVAVLVVPGVGDDSPGDTLDATVGALAGLDELGDGVREEIVVRVADRSPYRTSRVVMPGRGGPELHVYELCWSDLSRFPGQLRAFAATLVGLLLQLCTIGLEALRGVREGSARAGAGATLRQRLAAARRDAAEAAHLGMETAGWLLAVPVLLVTGELAVIAGAAVLTTVFDGSRAAQYVCLAVAGAASLGLALWAGPRLRGGGWWRAREAALATALAGIGLVGAVLVLDDEGDAAAASANALIIGVAYPFRIAWLLTCLAVLASLVALVAVARRGPAGARAATTGLLTTVLAPGALALLGATAFAAIGAIAVKAFGEDVRPADTAGRLLCLPKPGSALLERCAEIDAAARTAAAVPGEWGLRLFAQALVPLLATMIGAGLLALLAAWVATPVVWRILGPRGGREPAGQWLTLSRSLERLTGAGSRRIVVVVAAATVVAAAALWTVPYVPRLEPLAQATAAAAVLGTVLLVLARYLGLGRPGVVTASATGPMEVLRRVLDFAHDIATYLRIGHAGGRGGAPVARPRDLMLARYRAILRHIGERDLDGLVIVSHSQGTVLSAAALFGDPFVPEPAARGLPPLPPTIALVTMGSPLRQLYAERFPGAYGWVATAGGVTPVAPLAAWVNLFRAGDYVGRALWSPDPPAGRPWALPADPGAWSPDEERTHDACLDAGGHTGYFSEPAVARWIHRLACAGAAPAEAAPGTTAPDGRPPVPVRSP